MHKQAVQLVEDVSQLVSPPEVYYELERLIADGNSSLEDIAQVIRTDPDLSARLLRVANSAFYGFPAKIESIPRALSTIGTRQLRDLVLATTVVRLFSQIPFELVDMNAFWRHALHTGLLARSLARLAGEPNDERFYLVGLLHDVGHLVLYLKLPDQAHEILLQSREQALPRYRLEADTLGFDHGELGAALLMNWRLPEAIVEPVRFHHVPASAEHYPVEAGIVNVASDQLNQEPDADWPGPEAGALLQTLGIDSAQCEQARESADELLDELLATIGLKDG